MSNTRFQLARAELDKNYEIKETLGTGAFSEVKRAVKRSTGEPFAIKIIDRKKCVGKETMIQSEIDILKKVRHTNIIQLFDLYETEHKIYLIMQLVTGGELFDSIVARGHYTEVDAAKLVRSILLAVDYLHDMGIAHRDLKVLIKHQCTQQDGQPENLLFYDDGADAQIMVSDFGLSKIFSDEEAMKTACGTPGYVAPEVLRRHGYGKEVDLWSMGVIAYILLCGYPPFYSENNQQLFQQIMRGDYEFDSPNWDDVSSEAKDFVGKLLLVDSRSRFTAKQALSHPFITVNCAPSTDVATVTAEKPLPVLHGITGDYVPATGVNPANLAKRVSENLRTTQSRRRSADVVKQPHPPHGAPPLASSRRQSHKPHGDQQQQQQHPDAIVEEQSVYDSEKTIMPKDQITAKEQALQDSGVVSGDGDVDLQFLEQLSQVNSLISQGLLMQAYDLLQHIDCPHKLRKLYEDMIFNGKVTMDGHKLVVSGSQASSSPTDQYMSELSQLVQKTQPLSFRLAKSNEPQQPQLDTTNNSGEMIQNGGSVKASQESVATSAGSKKRPLMERIDDKVTRMMAYLTGGTGAAKKEARAKTPVAQ